MDEINYLKERKEEPVHIRVYHVLRILLLIGLVVAVGTFAVNQALEFRYRSVFLQTPCNLCADLNKNQSQCINDCFNLRYLVSADVFGNLRDQEGLCRNYKGEKINCKGALDFNITG